jgi:serine/threonine protein kinase
VKITDFGLSKIFTPETVELQNRARPTNEELAARAESFINCGNFNADHVRGTFGYMSPELILSGESLSRLPVMYIAVDVVRHILLLFADLAVMRVGCV